MFWCLRSIPLVLFSWGYSSFHKVFDKPTTCITSTTLRNWIPEIQTETLQRYGQPASVQDIWKGSSQWPIWDGASPQNLTFIWCESKRWGWGCCCCSPAMINPDQSDKKCLSHLKIYQQISVGHIFKILTEEQWSDRQSVMREKSNAHHEKEWRKGQRDSGWDHRLKGSRWNR